MSFEVVSILLMILVIFISLVFHELGHFLIAKIANVHTVEASLGIGPKILSFKTKKTIYSIRWIWIAAYVQLDSYKLKSLYNELIDDMEKENWFNKEIANLSFFQYIDNMFTSSEKKYFWQNFFNYNSYRNKSVKVNREIGDQFLFEEIKTWKKIFIILGGIIFNLLLFSIAFCILYFTQSGYIDPLESIKDFYIGLWNIIIWKQDSNTNLFIIDNYFQLFLIFLVSINLSLALLNIIPIPCLDGFKLFTVSFESIFKKSMPDKVEIIFQWLGIIFILYLTISSMIQQFVY